MPPKWHSCSNGVQIPLDLKWIYLDRCLGKWWCTDNSVPQQKNQGLKTCWKLCEVFGWAMLFEDKTLALLPWMTHFYAGFAAPSTLMEVKEEFKPENFKAESRSGYLVPWRLRPHDIVSDGVRSSPAMNMCLNSSKSSKIGTKDLKLSRCLGVLLHLG